MQPNLSLSYNSQSGIGPLGIGWAIGGLGAVTRCNLTYIQDSAPAPVALIDGDGYCINGNRLRLTSGTYGTAGSTYQTEVTDFSNVTMNGTAGSGPAYFSAKMRNGLTYYYGYTDSNGNGANSQVLATDSTTALYWLLSKVVDREGNNYVINYASQSGTSVVANILWTPTSLGASTYTYSMVFNYTTNAPQSSITKYVSGTLVSNPKLLSSIAIYNGSSVTQDYFLGYQASTTTSREELKTVQQCADSSQSNCLLPTTVGYQTGGLGVSGTASPALSSTGSGLTARYDLNGDGYPDLVYNNGTNWYVSFGSASGYGTPVNTTVSGASVALIGSLTGGTADGILANKGGTWYYYTWSSSTSSFSGVSAGLTYDSAASQYQLADVNGDGLPDLVSLYITANGTKFVATVDTRLNTGAGGTPTFSSTLTTAINLGGVSAAQLQTPDFQYGKLRRYDFNGDGRDDVAVMTVTGTSPSFTVNTYELISTGTGFTSTQIQTSSGSGYAPVFFTNWNNDACTDFVTSLLTPNTLYISGCNGTVATSYSVGTVVAAMDWDGDGRTDLVVKNGTDLGVYLSTGVAPGSTVLSTSIPYSSTCVYMTMDANADGLDDLGCWSQTGSNALTYHLHNGASTQPDLANSFVDGYGNSASPSYVALSQASSSVFTIGGAKAYPQQTYIGPMTVVSSVLLSDGIGGTYTLGEYYNQGVVNLQGRGFAGFGSTRATDSRNSLNRFVHYDTDFPWIGFVTADGTTQSSSTKQIANLVTHLSSITLSSTAYNERYYPYVDTSTATRYEVGGSEDATLTATSVTSYESPDHYGNFATVVTTTTDNDSASPYYNSQWTSTVATTVTADTSSNWCLNLPTERDVTNTAPGVSSITRHMSFTPDYTNCRETQQVVEPSSSTYKVTTVYGFDSFGNVNSQTVTGVGMPARTTGTTFGSTGQFPTQLKNALGQITYTNYDPVSAQLLNSTDPNGVETQWQYDSFFRKSKESRQDGTSTTWAYNNCATAGCVNTNNKMTLVQTQVNVGGAALRIDNTYLDTLDRKLVTSGQMLGGAYNRTEVQYDNLGRVHKSGMPCIFVSCTQYWTTNSYDAVNRLTQSQRPISASNSTLQTTLYTYQGRTETVNDPQSKATTLITQVTGGLGRTIDANGYYINFNRDAFGSVLSVNDSQSNTLQTNNYQYGVSAFVVSSTDMDLGNRSYTVDPLGEVTAWSDAKSQNFSMTYDLLSRPLVRNEPDLTTSWTWGTGTLSGAASYDVGKLHAISSTDSSGAVQSSTYSYDSDGRLLQNVISNPGDRTYTYAYTYNATTGLLDTLQYPVDLSFILALQYGYSYGVLQSVSSNSYSPAVTYWTANSTDARGQVTQETYGNGVVKTNAFDAVTGWLSSIQAGAGGGSGVQNNSYLYDHVGNLTQREDINQGLTESFYYDNVYRLDHSYLGSAVNLQMVYDGGSAGPGNITSRSDVAGGATWTYDTTRRHAVLQAGGSANSYTYDANGNASTRNGYTVGWTSFNYPAGFSTASESVSYSYGAGRQRWKEVYANSSGTETTYRAGKLFEVANYGGLAHFRHYVYAGSELVSIDDRTTAATPLYYVIADHQGSYSNIENSASPGTNFVSESFTAFGNRRNGETWSGSPTSADETNINSVSRRGFTGESVIGNAMGLNHLNGRVEDAITGRFLSADPVGISPSNTQSFNRYTYVRNNPLTLTDPSGFTPNQNIHPSPCNIKCRPDFWTLASGIGVGPGGGFGGSSGGYLSDLTDSLNALDDELNGAVASDVDGAFSTVFGSSGGTSFAGAADDGSGSTDSAGSGTTTQSAGSAQHGAAGGSATFQVCSDGVCSDPINPDLEPIVPDIDRFYYYPKDPGAVVSVPGPVEAVAFGAAALVASGSAAAAEDVGGEIFYRTMSQGDFASLNSTGAIPATSETFISPSLEYASQYEGTTVQFTVNSGTTDSLLGIGVRGPGLTADPYAALPAVESGWTSSSAFFKLEGGAVNIGLGQGSALQLFNSNIINFAVAP